MAVERARWLQPPVWLVNLPRWWLGELAAQFPRAAQWLGGAGGGARLVCGDFRTVLKGDAGMELKCWDNALGALTDTQRRDLRAACPAGEVDIELSTVQALQIEVRIPEAARDIGQAVRMALLADSPLRLEAIAFDWRLGGDGDSPTLRPGWKTAQVALCRLATLHRQC